MDDLITYRLIKTVGIRRTYLYDNVDKATINGLETGFSWNVSSNLLWNTNLTLLDTKDETTGKELNDRPGISLASTVDWTIGQGWSSRGGVEYYGQQSSSTGDLPPTPCGMPVLASVSTRHSVSGPASTT